jgi:hypothetical protein
LKNYAFSHLSKSDHLKKQSQLEAPAFVFLFSGIPTNFLGIFGKIHFEPEQIEGRSLGIVGTISPKPKRKHVVTVKNPVPPYFQTQF